MINIDIYLDAETVPPKMDDRELEIFKDNLQAPKTMKKADTIETWKEANWLDKYKKMATDTNKAQIITLGFSLNKEKPIIFINDEFKHDELLEAFYGKIKEKAIAESIKQGIHLTDEDLEGDDFMSYLNLNWFGHNVRKFDLDLLWKHAIKERNEKIARLIPRKRYDQSVKDTMEIFTAGNNEYISQDEICKILGIKGKPDDIDGSKVYDYYIQGRLEEIAAYQEDDVLKVIEISERLYLS